MGIVYLGTSAFAASVLERLAGSDHRPTLVVTRPDRPRGRGRRPGSPPVAEVGAGNGIEVIQPLSVNSEEARARIAAERPDAVAICAFGGLIAEPLLSEHEMLNVHPSLLPRWRGAAPIERAIDAGDTETGVSIMRPTADLDAGPVCLARSEPIHPDDDFGSLSARLEALAGDLLVEALDRHPPFVEQPDEGVSFAKKITAQDRRLAPTREAEQLARRVRALSPHVVAFVELPAGDRLLVLHARPAEQAELGVDPSMLPEPGRLAGVGGGLFFGCRDGAVELLRVKPAGGREMDARDYLRGRRPAGSSKSGTG